MSTIPMMVASSRRRPTASLPPRNFRLTKYLPRVFQLTTDYLLPTTAFLATDYRQPTTTSMSKPRILIIEDERALTDVLVYNLTREGYETIIANDGQEGLRKAQTLLPEIIILDLMLPLMNGLEVCRELKAGERTRS